MIAPDKLKHMAAGLAAFIFASLILMDAGAGLFAAVVLGFGKEKWDASHPGHVVDVWDAFATVAPAGVMWLVCMAWPQLLASFAA